MATRSNRNPFSLTAFVWRRSLGFVLALTTGAACCAEPSGRTLVDDWLVRLASATEDSILVDSRAEPPRDDAEAAANKVVLEPISQISEYSPRPADPEPGPSAETAAAATDNVADSPAGGDEAEKTAETAAAEPEDGPVRFRGVAPGATTQDDLISEWGEPAGVSKTTGGEVLLYELDQFARVDVLVEQGVVEIIRAEPPQRDPADEVERRLAVDKIDSVEVTDPDTGDPLAIAYPEKGLMLMLAEPEESAAPDAPQAVTHIVINRLDAEAFALRAERRPDDALTPRLADLTRAIEIDPQHSYAHYLASGVFLATGQVDRAAESARLAAENEPSNNAYRMRLAKALIGQGEYDKAVIETRAVLDTEKQNGLIKAEALHTMGRLASLGDMKISDKAIAFHTMAIGIADKLATTADGTDRRAAKRLLVEAHLAIAGEIARRDYDEKTEVVAQWIGRASALAEEMIKNDKGGLELRLLVARDALGALASLKPSKDPRPWIDEATEAAAAIREATDDPLTIARTEWMLGKIHYHALQIEHTRGNADEAIGFGRAAIDHLIAGAAAGDIRPEAERLVGRLYFHLGAVNAVHRRDHEKAIDWYDRARPLLSSEAPPSKLYVPRRRGETLVSMAVSYWNQNKKDLALELTVAGADLMERAVNAGVLEEKALGVPYGNLATMHSKLGDEQKSSEFAKLARSARGVATASRQAPAGRSGARGQSR